jgi:hypothetical protein
MEGGIKVDVWNLEDERWIAQDGVQWRVTVLNKVAITRKGDISHVVTIKKCI